MAARKPAQTDEAKRTRVVKPFVTDFSQVASEVTEEPLPAKSQVDNTPFPKWYAESFDTGNTRVLNGLTEDQVDEAKRLANLAVNRFRAENTFNEGRTCGLRHHVKENSDGTYTYSFVAVERNERVRKSGGDVESADA